MNTWKVFLANALENVAIAICITCAAIHFEKWRLLWFLIIILLNSVTTTNYKVSKVRGGDEHQ